jgi:pilus assembly protein Flp/PilA
MLKVVKNLIKDEKGQGMTEYGLVLGAIAIGAIAVLVALRGQISTFIDGIGDSLPTAGELAPTTP